MKMHSVACCAPCPVCKKKISYGIDAHVEACQARFDRLAAEAKRAQTL